MKVRHFAVVAAAAAVLMLSACVTNKNNTIGSVSPFLNNVSLEKLNYKVIGETTAEATRKTFLLIDWAHLFNDDQAGGFTGGYGTAFMPVEGAKGEATLAALAKVPNADRLLDPRYVISTKAFIIPIFYTEAKVTVYAKAIQYTGSISK